MITPISFTSTYKVKSSANKPEEYTAFKYYANKRSRKDATMKLDETRTPLEYNSTTKLTVADNDDDSVEYFCAQNGIKFIKFSREDV